MALLDSFAGSNGGTSGLDNAIAAINGSGPINNNPTSDSVSGSKYYKVKILAQTEHGGLLTVVADGPSEFVFDTSVEYETPYQNLIGDTIDMAHRGFKLDESKRNTTCRIALWLH